MTYDYLVRTSKESEIALTLKEAIRMAKEYSSKGEIATIERTLLKNECSTYDDNWMKVCMQSEEKETEDVVVIRYYFYLLNLNKQILN